MAWNPEKYNQFQTQRSAPFYDLLGLVEIRPNLKVVDLGCGTGELTRRLADSLPDSQVLGLDTSPQMLERSSEYERPGLRFENGDQSQLEGSWDLIFSNASLHWSDNHETLIPNLFKRLEPCGQLAIQVPSNHDSPTHQSILEVAGREPFHSALGGWTRQYPVLTKTVYAELLFLEGAADIIVFERIYPHVLENAAEVLDWISGTALLPYFDRLGELKESFLDALRQKLAQILPGTPVFYPFKRTFISARSPDCDE